MQTYKVYSEVKCSNQPTQTASDFFRREISETRNFTRKIVSDINQPKVTVKREKVVKK